MARQIQTDGTATQSSTVIAHNSILYLFAPGFVHGDGPDTDKTSVAQYPSGGAPTTFSGAVTLLNNARTWWNAHLGYAGNGQAHKVADAVNTLSTGAMSAASTYEATMLAALIVLATEETTDYTNHIANTGGAFHTGADTVDILGVADVLTTLDDVCERLNNIKLNFNLHIVNVTGVHGASGAVDAISTPNANASAADAYDLAINLANAIRTKLNAHLAQGAAIHPGGADAVNTVSGAAVSYPSGLFDLATEFRTDFNAHVPDLTYHYIADATAIAAAAPSTIATLITFAAELYADMLTHFNGSPGAGVVQGLRIVA